MNITRTQLLDMLAGHAEMILEVLDADPAQCAAWRARGAEASAAYADAMITQHSETDEIPCPRCNGRGCEICGEGAVPSWTVTLATEAAAARMSAPAPGGVVVLRQCMTGPLALPGSRDPDPGPGMPAVPDWELGGVHCGACGALDHPTRDCPPGPPEG